MRDTDALDAAPRSPQHDDPLTRREAFALWLLAFVAIRWVAPSGPLYWDSFGYTAQAVTGQVGGLGLGRPLFVLVSHGVASALLKLGASLEHVEPVLRALWSGISALSAPLVALAATKLDFSSTERRFAALAVALSPAMAHASGQVLTDGPAVALIVASTTAALFAKDGEGAREAGLWLASGALLGAAVVFREPSLAHAFTLYALVALGPKGARSRSWVTATAGLLLVSGLSLAWAARQPGWGDTVRAWVSAMRRERAAHPYSLRDLGLYVAWLFALGPLVTLAAIATWVRARREIFARSKAFAVVALGSLAPLALLAIYQDISFSPRYLLGAMPFAVAVVAAPTLARWARTQNRVRLVMALLVTTAIVSGWGLSRREKPLRAAIDTVEARLRSEPPTTRGEMVIVTGQLCPAVQLAARFERVRAERERRAPVRWITVCPGWDWPSNIGQTLEAHVRRQTPVIVDLRDESWVGERQREARASVAAWASTATATGAGLVRVW